MSTSSSNPESIQSDTLSLGSEFNETVTINGRTYQQISLEKGCSYTPIDDAERERLDKQHAVLQLIFDGRLIFPPIENPQNILDCGYGSGAWAVDVAEKYPECRVVGVDISPHMQPEYVPQNLWLQADDLNMPFTFHANEFDLVHSRGVVTGIDSDRWTSYIEDCVRVCKPGGWLQFVEPYHNIQSDNGTLTDDHAIRQVSTLFARAIGEKKDIRVPMRMGEIMRNAGLVSVSAHMIQVPLNDWPADPRNKEIGMTFNQPYKDAISAHCQYPFLEHLGMDISETHILFARAKQDIDNPSLKPYIAVYVAIGQKPNS